MKNMKKILFSLFISLSIVIPGVSQKLEKYEDALPGMLSLPPSGAIAELKRYLPEEPQNASLYLQMALIYEKRYLESDAFKDYEYKVGNAREALKAFELAENFLTEKDVRKNDENYYNFGTIDEKGRLDVGYDTVINKITTAKIELKGFIDNAPLIYEKFTKSFSSYDQAHKNFTEILGEYPTFKDLYLLYNDDVDRKFEQIKTDLQECLKYWEEYKEASANYSVGHNQKMVIKPIKIYRLDGLESKINFLQNEISVWDYVSWVDTTRTIISSEIDRLRTNLAAENLRLDKKLKEAESDFVRDTFEPLKVSKEVLFNLRKYDLTSVIEPLFLYKEKKHNLIYQELLSKNLDTATTLDVDRKLYLYGQMVNRIKEADSVLLDVRKSNTRASLDKYHDFVSMYYKDEKGIDHFVTQQLQTNQGDAKSYVSNIRSELYKLLTQDSVVSTVSYKQMDIPLQESLSMENDLITANPITTHRVENFDGSMFVGGIFKNESENKTQAYVCGVTKDKTLGWYNDYLLQIDSSAGFDSDTRIGAMQTIPGGLAVILNGVDTNGVRLNHLLMLDESGGVTLSRRLLLTQFPRTISYNERTNTLFVTYKGDDYLDDIFQQSELIMAQYNILGDLQWQQRISYKGDVTGVVGVDRGYILIGNYNEIKGMDGKINRAGQNNTDTKLFTLKLDLAGEISNLTTIDHSASFYANKAYKVSDDCINLFGSVGSYQKLVELDAEPERAVHIIVNKDLEVLANSLN